MGPESTDRAYRTGRADNPRADQSITEQMHVHLEAAIGKFHNAAAELQTVLDRQLGEDPRENVKETRGPMAVPSTIGGQLGVLQADLRELDGALARIEAQVQRATRHL